MRSSVVNEEQVNFPASNPNGPGEDLPEVSRTIVMEEGLDAFDAHQAMPCCQVLILLLILIHALFDPFVMCGWKDEEAKPFEVGGEIIGGKALTHHAVKEVPE
ncbi:hypothetical protein B0A55_13708, partial [Friedmanniomyces simplex]